MSTTSRVRAGRSDQHRYQHQVEALLGQISGRVQELQRLKAYGVRGPALAEQRQALARTRQQLADLVEHQLAATRATAHGTGWQLAPNP